MTSTTVPMKLAFRTDSGDIYRLLFKYGDDVRQDMFFLHMLSYIDYQLRKENLDLRLTPYRVLAVSRKHGMVEWVTAAPISKIIQDHGNIRSFLALHNANPSGPLGLSPVVVDNFLRSCGTQLPPSVSPSFVCQSRWLTWNSGVVLRCGVVLM